MIKVNNRIYILSLIVILVIGFTTTGLSAPKKPDIILFIGHLRLIQFLLMRVPRKSEPQPLPLIFNLTSSSYNEYFEPFSDEENWNFGLMNFDVR